MNAVSMITNTIILCTFLHVVRGITIYNARIAANGYSGYVEVLTHQGWLPVCWSYSYWSTSESIVLCRQLGYDVTSDPSTGSTSSYSTSLVFDFSCTGSELQISDCSYALLESYTSSSCSPVVTVSCSPCTSGSVQLHGGVVSEAGTVEFCINGVWQAVCDSNWDYKDAFVVCRELGLPATEVVVYSQSYFGDHPIPSGLYFDCFGNETSLNDCQKPTTTCDFANVAGVYCTGNIITAWCTEGLLRLVDGRDSNEGRIEICSNGVWGTIYGRNWDINDASVVCRRLGYQAYSRVEALRVSDGFFKGGTGPILFGNLYCAGTESRLTDCSSGYNYDATHSDDAGVRCLRTDATTQTCTNGEARLVNGSTASEGRVEICYAGIWGSVCDSSWGNQDAAIVCMQLGFQGTNATALRGSYFGDGDGPYHLNGVSCSGGEKTLLECSHNTIGYHTCTPGHDAGARCDASVCTHHELHLFRTSNGDQYGVAEICINGFWADICYSSSYATNVASKFCKEYMGIHSLSFSQSCCSGISRRNTGNLTLYGVSCSGNSDFFTQDCSYNLVSNRECSPQSELIVGCYLPSTRNCTQNNIHLVGGNSSLEGRVEMCYENLWGAIYGYSWDANDAMVACRQLGLPWEWALADQNDLFGRGNSRIAARDFRCTGSEQQLISCSFNYVPLSSGTSYQSNPTASVICQGDTSKPTECEHGDVRLVGGPTEMEGRVEFCSYGYWAVACDNNWDKDESNAVCKQLGFPTNASEYVLKSVFGSNYQLPLVGLSCGSGASHISQCQFNNQTRNCNHKRTVGVICKERSQHYQINIYATPKKESYDIGSQVMLNCIATPSPHKYRNYNFSLIYHWLYYDGGGPLTFSNYRTITLLHKFQQNSIDVYCLIFRNGLLLGTGQIKLQIRSVLRVNSTMSSFATVQATHGENLTLQVETLDYDVVELLLELTWYHNNRVILPRNDSRVSLSSDNRTLTVTNFTSSYAGAYKVQFNQLFVHPYNEECKNEVLSLMRNNYVFKPSIFCVNIKENDCFDGEIAENPVIITVHNLNSNIQGNFPHNLSLKAIGIATNSKILEHSSFVWYRNGYRLQLSTLSPLQRHYNNLSFTQELHLFNISYEHTGTYEVLVQVEWSNYIQESGCQLHNNRFVVPFIRQAGLIVAKGYSDVHYYKGLTFSFDADSRAVTSDKGATLTCRASIEFPPFFMLSLIKNGQTVATSSSGLLETNTKNVNANPFGLYACHLNASGSIFKKPYFLEEQVTLRMTINSESSSITCDGGSESAITEAFLLKITNECHCTIDQSVIYDSNSDCIKGGLVYTVTIHYSNEDGSETASTITERIIGQVPFSLTVTGVPVTVSSACTDCRVLALTAAEGGGLFVGGFIAATLIAGVSIVIFVVVIRKRRSNAADISRRAMKQESKDDPSRYIAPKVQKKTEPTAAAKAKKLKAQQLQQKPAGNQRKAKVDPKTLYDTPRAERQAAGSSGRPVERMEISQEKDVYEDMDAERESVYEETF